MQSIVRRIEYISKASSVNIERSPSTGRRRHRLHASFETDYVIRNAVRSGHLSSGRARSDRRLSRSVDQGNRWLRREFRFRVRADARARNSIGNTEMQGQGRHRAAGSSDGAWITDKEDHAVQILPQERTADTLVGFKDDDGKETMKLASEIRENRQGNLRSLIEDIENGVIDGQTRGGHAR